jgi:glycine cleavage system transcriptional repressor
LVAAGVSIGDSQMAILGGHFTMVLMLHLPAEVDVDELRAGLEAAGQSVGLEALTLSEVDELDFAPPDPTHLVSVYGADHVGIVHAVTKALASRGVNVTDLSTRLLGAGEEWELYVMLLEVVARDVDLDELLADVRQEQGVEISVRALEHDAL